jgi:hypothetical protein
VSCANAIRRNWSQHEKREVLYSPSYRATHLWNSQRETWSINWAETVRPTASGILLPTLRESKSASLKTSTSGAMLAIVYAVYRLH